MRWSVLLVILHLVGCGFPTVAPAPRDGLTPQQSESYRALAHELSAFMQASAQDAELDLNLAAILEEVLLHVRAAHGGDWDSARTEFEQAFQDYKVTAKTVIRVMLSERASWIGNWRNGERWTGEPSLDEILSFYEIQVTKEPSQSDLFFALTVPREVNHYALENKIGKVAGFLYPSSTDWDLYGWGNPLHLNTAVLVRPDTRVSGWTLRIDMGSGDCPSGCIAWRSYTFQVDSDGDTRLVSCK